MDTIFLSSTCYDLADLRSILMDSLTAAGFSTIASDVPSSDFTLVPYKNSVETCETNVARSDLLLLILDRRYGPAIPDFGGKSATHIEYDTAVRCRIPVVTFVRRAFLNDHRIWHKMTSSGHSATEVAKALGHVDITQRKNSFEFVPLFALFDSVRRASERGKFNWVDSFDTAQEVSRMASRRAREILHAEAFRIQSSLRSIAASPSPVSLSAEYVTRAIASIGELELTDTELYVLAQAALNHKVNGSLVVERMSEKQRTSFLTAFASKLIKSDAGAAMMIRFKSAAIIDTIRAWLDSNHEFRPCMIAIQRLGFDVDFVTDGVRRMVHQVLWHTYDVAHLGFEENAEKLLEDKLSALTIIGHVGERSDLTAVIRCLLERGIPTVSGDPEHMSWDDPPGTISYRRQGVIVNAAEEVFRELHSRGVCLLTALPEDWLSRLRCEALRINIARTLISTCDHISAEDSRAIVSAILQANASDELCDELLQKSAECGLNLEDVLLGFLNSDSELVSRSLVGLIWHATDSALPSLLKFADSCAEHHLERVAYVLRYLIDGSMRQAIVQVIRQRVVQIQVRGNNEVYKVARIITALGARELLSLLDTARSSDYEVGQRRQAVEDVEVVEVERKSGIPRAKSWVVVPSWSQETFVRSENACIEEVRLLKSVGVDGPSRSA